MEGELVSKVKAAVAKGTSTLELKSELVSQGFLEDDVVKAIEQVTQQKNKSENSRNERVFLWKELFDRVGYGFTSNQFINILFYNLGASFFLIGFVNGLKIVLSMALSSALAEFSKFRNLGKKLMSFSGILFGMSFMAISLAILFRSLWFFSIAFIIGSLGVVTYGDLYQSFVEKNLKREKASRALLFISRYGIIITAFSMLLSGFLFDKFPITEPHQVNFYGNLVPLFGYLICFEITAIMFILSGYVLSFIKESKEEYAPSVIRAFREKLKAHKKVLLSNRYAWLLLFASSVTALVQIVGNAYYGVYIFDLFKDSGFGAYLNIAIIFSFAIFVSFVGPAFSTFVNRKVGLAPTLVFGNLLIAIMPLVCIYNPHLMNLMVAYGISVIGAAILGLGQGLLLRKLLTEEERTAFFSATNILTAIPFLVLITLGALVADAQGLIMLFKLLAAILLIISAPLYFLIVLLANKMRL